MLERDRDQPKLLGSAAPDIRGGAERRPAARPAHSSTHDRGRSAPWRSRRSPSTSRDPRCRQTLAKARTAPSSPRMTMTLSPRYSSVAPLAGLGDLAFVAHHLRRGAQERPLLGLEEFGIVIEPAGQAHAVERIGAGLDGFQLRRHAPTLAISATLRQWRLRWGCGVLARRPSAYLDDSRRGVRTGAASAIGQHKR